MGVYPATRFDLEFITEKPFDAFTIISIPFFIIDLPISFIYETLLLPHDYYYEVRDHCNRYDNKARISEDISMTSRSYLVQKYYSDDRIKTIGRRVEVNITQMHQKYNYALVQYNFDNFSEKRLSLFAIRNQDIKTKAEYIYDGVDNNTEQLKNYIKKNAPKEIYEMIDCYK